MKAWIQLDMDELQQRWGELPAPESEAYKGRLVEVTYLRLLEREAAKARLRVESYPFIGNQRFMPSEGEERKVWVYLDFEELGEWLNIDPKGEAFGHFLVSLGAYRFLDCQLQRLHTPGVLRGHQRLDQAMAWADGQEGNAPSGDDEGPRYPPAEEAPELVEA